MSGERILDSLGAHAASSRTPEDNPGRLRQSGIRLSFRWIKKKGGKAQV